jgi:hypothetical protein
MGANMIGSSRFSNAWNDYRRRRRWLIVWICSPLPVLLWYALFDGKEIPGIMAFWGFVFLIIGFRLSTFRCPRCGNFFFLKFLLSNQFARRCVHCGLPKWSLDASDKEKMVEKQ